MKFNIGDTVSHRSTFGTSRNILMVVVARYEDSKRLRCTYLNSITGYFVTEVFFDFELVKTNY